MSAVLAHRITGEVLYRLCIRCGIDLPAKSRAATRMCRDCYDVTRRPG